MPPKLLSDDGNHVVIRPLAYCTEQDIARYAGERQFPIIPCNLCGSQPNLQRQAIKEMLAQWKRKHPGRIENIFRAIGSGRTRRRPGRLRGPRKRPDGLRDPAAARGFLACFDALAATYLAGVDWEPPAALERRAARLLPGLFLARVDGGRRP